MSAKIQSINIEAYHHNTKAPAVSFVSVDCGSYLPNDVDANVEERHEEAEACRTKHISYSLHS